jgi:predicted histone-like DNA-binding protein
MSLIYKKTTKVLNFNKENPVTYYKLQQMKQSKVTYEQLKQDVLRASGLSKTQTQAAIDGMVESLCHFMELGHTVQLGGFGTIRPIFKTKAQDSMDKVGVDNVTRCKLILYPGKDLKATLKNITFESGETDSSDDFEDENNTNTGTNPSNGASNGNGENTGDNGSNGGDNGSGTGNGGNGGDGEGGDDMQV